VLKAVANLLWLYRILFPNLSVRRNISRSPAIFLRTRGTAIRASREARAGDTTTELHHRWSHFSYKLDIWTIFHYRIGLVLNIVFSRFDYFRPLVFFFLALVISFSSFLSTIPGILGSFQEFLGHQHHWLSRSSFSLLPLCLLEFGDCPLLSVVTY